MDKRYDVLTFGDLCVDLIVSGKDVIPEFGQKEKLVDDYSLEMGGSCSIFACQAAKLGLKTVVAGKVGNDMYGRLVLDTLEKSGVITRFIGVDSRLKTGIGIALNKFDDRAILTYTGSIDSLGREDVDEELLMSVRHLHIGSFYLMKKLQPHYPEIARKIKNNGGTVSLDTNWDPAEEWDGMIWDVLPYTDILLLNENEIMGIAKMDNLEKAVEHLGGKVPVIVVKRGKEGAVAYDCDNIYSCPSVSVAEIKDTIGAGDSFDAGFVFGYISGKSIEECIKIGCICGSLNTRAAGGTKGQPRLDEILDFLSRIQVAVLCPDC